VIEAFPHLTVNKFGDRLRWNTTTYCHNDVRAT